MSYYTFGDDAPPAQSTADPCNPCYDAKSEAYRACQSFPAGSEQRETCFRKADADLGNCLDACRGKPAGTTAKLLLLGGAAVVAVALLT